MPARSSIGVLSVRLFRVMARLPSPDRRPMHHVTSIIYCERLAVTVSDRYGHRRDFAFRNARS